MRKRSSNRPARLMAAVMALLLAGIACTANRATSPRPAPTPAPPGQWNDYALDKGWISVSVGVPRHGTPPYPVVLSPTVPDHLLLERGIGVVRWKTNWEILRGLTPTSAPSPQTQTETETQTQTETQTETETETVGAWLLRAPRPGIVGQGYFRVIKHEAHQSVPKVLDLLESLPSVDSQRMAITGNSTGGFIALQALAEEPRLDVAVIQVACGDYLKFLKSSSLALGDQDRWLVDGEVVLDDEYMLELAASDPIHRTNTYPPRPLLLISGAQDPVIPPACVRATAEAISATYEKSGVPDRFEWEELAAQGHALESTTTERVLNFLDHWLHPQPK